MQVEKRRFSAQQLVDGYETLFPPIMRAATFACLEHAQLTLPDRWPHVPEVKAFAKLYGVDAAELGAFFGLLQRNANGRTVWIDALRGPVSPDVLGKDLNSPGQARAFGFQCAFAEVAASEARA